MMKQGNSHGKDNGIDDEDLLLWDFFGIDGRDLSSVR